MEGSEELSDGERIREPVDRAGYPVRLGRLHDPVDDSYVHSLTAAERIAMI